MKSFGKDVVFGTIGGAVVGGGMAFVKGKNVWFGGDVASGRTRFSFNNTPTVNSRSGNIGYSLDDLADEGIDVGKLTREVGTEDVTEFLKNNNILARKGNQISKEIVDEYLWQMKNKTFNLRSGAAGYTNGPIYMIDDGHHKIVAAAIRGMQTGDFNYLQLILKNGNFRPWNNGNLKFGTFPSRWNQ